MQVVSSGGIAVVASAVQGKGRAAPPRPTSTPQGRPPPLLLQLLALMGCEGSTNVASATASGVCTCTSQEGRRRWLSRRPSECPQHCSSGLSAPPLSHLPIGPPLPPHLHVHGGQPLTAGLVDQQAAQLCIEGV